MPHDAKAPRADPPAGAPNSAPDRREGPTREAGTPRRYTVRWFVSYMRAADTGTRTQVTVSLIEPPVRS